MGSLSAALQPHLQSLHKTLRPDPVAAPEHLPATHLAIHLEVEAILQAADAFGQRQQQQQQRYPACALMLEAAGQPHRIAALLQVRGPLFCRIAS
jgi:hypothetical protein